MPETTKPFAGYANFAACVRANSDKEDPDAYCASIMRQVEGGREEEKSVWSTAFVNDLPDSAFLFVEPGDKEDGKTVPRSKRHFPYQDASGKIDLPHLRNAIARIPQSNAPGLTPEKKRALQERARRLLERQAEKAPPDLSSMSAMIALYPDPVLAKMLAIDPSISLAQSGVALQAPEELHVTLAYFPDVQEDKIASVLQAAAVCASNCAMSITTEVEGVGQFLTEDDTAPYVLLLDPTNLRPLNDMLMMCEGVSRSHGFIPHMTLAYVPKGTSLQVKLPEELPLTFTKLSAVIHGQRYDFPLSSMYGVPTSYPQTAYRARLQAEIDTDGDVHDVTQRPPLGMSQSEGEGMSQATVTTEEVDAEKAGRRLAGSWRDQLSNIAESVKKLLTWANYEDDEDEDSKTYEEALKAITDGERSFVVFKDANGDDRWLAFSSNGFEDREREIVATRALEVAVERADAMGDHGPLRLWHVPGSDHGRCDFQAVHGRFLIESGTFDATEFASKALEYYQTTEDELGVSIGFVYPEDAFDGQTYHEVSRIIERSVCPSTVAANPWTSFVTIKGADSMNAQQLAFLNKVAGPEFTRDILDRAEKATAHLESQVAFKTSPAAEAAATLKALVDASGDDAVKAAFEVLTKAVSEDKDEDASKEEEEAKETAKAADDAIPALTTTELAETISELLKPVIEAQTKTAQDVANVATAMNALQSQVKTIEEKASNTPRGAQVYRATEAADNEMDAEKAKSLLGESQAPTSPVAGYIQDLIGASRNA